TDWSCLLLSNWWLSGEVPWCHAGCAEVDSMTEAVAGEGFLLGCISCKKREEVSARATVDWHFKRAEGHEFTQIFHYKHPDAQVLHEDFSDRLQWQGTLNDDVQIGAVFLQNVTFNDSGTYRCTFRRTLLLQLQPENVVVEKEVELTVVAAGEQALGAGPGMSSILTPNRELTAVISEIVMYVLIMVLQLWLILVMVYCYKKIWNEHEAREAKKALEAEGSLLESKDPCDGVQAELTQIQQNQPVGPVVQLEEHLKIHVLTCGLYVERDLDGRQESELEMLLKLHQ
ncbi:hypothetical protein CCH79_00018562, partial [Gambusia affinis]